MNAIEIVMCDGEITTRDFCESGRHLGDIAAPIVADISAGGPPSVALAGAAIVALAGVIGVARQRAHS